MPKKALTHTEKAEALAKATGLTLRAAECALVNLKIEHGLTIYHMKEAHTPKRSPKARPVTEETKEDIRRFWRANPNATQSEVAAHFGVNAGRVSEALEEL